MFNPGDTRPSVPVKLIGAAGGTEADTLGILGPGRVVLFGVPASL